MGRLLITGGSGFVGRTLLSYLPNTDYGQRYDLIPAPPDFDITLAGACEELISQVRPDGILHLAGQSHVPTAFADPAATLTVNVVGTANLLRALRESGFGGRLLYVGSADVYGRVDEASLPITEAQPLMPRNPYAVSKASAEMLCRQWHWCHGLDVVMARPFNHVGPGQSPDFALSGFARSVATIALGMAPPRIAVGDIDVTRDFSDVRDVIDAYFALLERGQTGKAYNVCSGREYRLSDLLQRLMDIAGVVAEIVPDRQRFRPAEQRRMHGSHEQLTQDTGWRPCRTMDDTLQELLNAWLLRLRQRP